MFMDIYIYIYTYIYIYIYNYIIILRQYNIINNVVKYFDDYKFSTD